jgi:hypothetical protein
MEYINIIVSFNAENSVVGDPKIIGYSLVVE